MSKLNVNDIESLKRNIIQHPYQVRVVYNDREERTVDIDTFAKTMGVFYHASLEMPYVKKVFIQVLVVVNDEVTMKVYDIDDVLNNRVTPKIQTLF
jgi:hypothetical protein